VSTPTSQTLAYTAAAEGIVLLTNDGTLPLASSIKNVAFIGPWANATTQMQGNYQGVAPFLIGPFAAAVAAGLNATFTPGTSINSTSQSGFAAAISAASAADAIIFAGGIDNSIEAESRDRTTIVWPGNQLDLISRLAILQKPLVVLQMGGGQVDSSSLKNNTGVRQTCLSYSLGLQLLIFCR
jgi:beta-D-xylosidase 4